MSVTLRDVILAVSYGDASLVGETAGYLILGAADAALSSSEHASLDGVTIDEEGTVRLAGPRVEEDEAERALRDLLGALLRKVRIPSSNLERVVARRELRGLRGLVTELEAALVPANRRAARRTLARLCRETKKSANKEREFAAVEEVVPTPHENREPAPTFDPSPEPPPSVKAAAQAPSPRAPLAEVRSSRAESVSVDVARASRRPTVPQKPGPDLLAAVAGIFSSQTPVESAARVAPEASSDEFDEAFGFDQSIPLDDSDFDVADELDEAPTQVFAGVAPVVASPSLAPLPPEPMESRPQATKTDESHSAREVLAPPPTMAATARALSPAPTPRRRRHSVVPRQGRNIDEEESLIVMSESAPLRTQSDISELLDRMSVAPMSTDELYTGLKALSRIELSPALPPVGPTWIDDRDR